MLGTLTGDARHGVASCVPCAVCRAGVLCVLSVLTVLRKQYMSKRMFCEDVAF